MFDYINNHAKNIQESIFFPNKTKRSFEYVIEFNICVGDLRKNPIHPDTFDFFRELQINDTKISSITELDKNLKFYEEEDTQLSFHCLKSFNFENEIILFSTQGLEKIILELLSLKVNVIKNIKNKLILKTFIADSKHFSTNIKSSILSINSTDSIIKIDEKATTFINQYSNTNAVIGLIPNVLDEKSLKHISLMPLIKSLLSFIANESKVNSFHFKGKFNLTISSKNSYDDPEKMLKQFKSLKILFEYFNSNVATKDQKKTFIRKTICDKLTKDEKISLNDLSLDFFDVIYKDASFLFDTFRDNEVSIFLKEKKEVLKEYLALSKDINNNINNSVNDLIKSLITILTFLITNVILFSKSVVSINTFIIVMFSCSILIIFFLVIHVTIKYSEIEIINEKQKLFSKHFSFLPSKSESIKEDLENMVVQEILRFDNILGYITIIYMCLLLIVLSLILVIK